MPGSIRDTGDIVRLIRADAWRMRVLAAVSVLDLPDCWIGAGFVRNAVWDALHGYEKPTPLNDVDVLYFDPGDVSRACESRYEATLTQAAPGVPWSIRNQARMHLRNGDAPYRSVVDAMWHWLETPTGVAVRLNADGGLDLISAHGIGDLVDLVARPTPQAARKPDEYEARMRKKNWPAIWPRLGIRGLKARRDVSGHAGELLEAADAGIVENLTP